MAWHVWHLPIGIIRLAIPFSSFDVVKYGGCQDGRMDKQIDFIPYWICRQKWWAGVAVWSKTGPYTPQTGPQTDRWIAGWTDGQNFYPFYRALSICGFFG